MLGKCVRREVFCPNPIFFTLTRRIWDGILSLRNMVEEVKAGKIEFRVDKTAIIHVPLGKLSFSDDQLVDNANALMQAIVRAKPATAKGKYLISVHVASTMGPGVPIDPVAAEAAV